MTALKKADLVKDVAEKESEIMTKLWELYHKSVKFIISKCF
jgi:hypothetical protein